MKLGKRHYIIGGVLVLLAFLVFSGTFAGMFKKQTIVPNTLQASSAGDSISVCVTLENDGGATENGLLELQPIRGASALSVGSQETCDNSAGSQQNVHKDFSIMPGGSDQICLTSSGLSAGTYTIKLVSTDSCCNVNSGCKAMEPYGWGEAVGTVTVAGGSSCTPHASKDCYGNNLYWVNSCGRQEEALQPLCKSYDFPDQGFCDGAKLECIANPSVNCGDGKCQPGESTASCPKDCSGKNGAVCGDGACNLGETTASCAKDCPKTVDKTIIIIVVGAFVALAAWWVMLK